MTKKHNDIENSGNFSNKEDKKKTKKTSFLTILGIIMIISGLSFIAWDLGSTYFERKAIDTEMQEFFNAAQLGEEQAMPGEVKDDELWGMIEIEKLDLKFPIIQSDNWDYLSRYVVAWEQSVSPPDEGNFSIAGHNGRCASCVFRNFEKLEIKDTIKLTDKNNTHTYEIYDIFEVFHTDTSVLNETPGETTVTLVTCTEQTHYDEYRTIVKGKLINSEVNQ